MAAGRRRPALTGGVVVAVLFAGVLAVGGGPRTIDGSVTLVDDAFMDMDDGTSCTGSDASWGYSDISSGTTVVVKDDGGDVIATTSLGPGTVDYDGCVFDFEVEVDDADGYSIEASHRGSLYYSRDDLDADDWQLDLSLGDD